MTRYIDADAVLKELKKSCEYHAENSRELSLLQRDIIIVQEQPTVDAVPVRHGKWIPCAKSGLILTEQLRREGIRWYGFKCSACNFVRKGNAPREANYCECCGARMEEE